VEAARVDGGQLGRWQPTAMGNGRGRRLQHHRPVAVQREEDGRGFEEGRKEEE